MANIKNIKSLAGGVKDTLGSAKDIAGGTIDSAKNVVGNISSVTGGAKDIVNSIPTELPELPTIPKIEKPQLPKLPKIPLPTFAKRKEIKVEQPPENPKFKNNSSEETEISDETSVATPPPSGPNPEGIPAEYRRVYGGSLFNESNARGAVAYAKDVGFGQVEVYRIEEVYGVDGVSKSIAGPYRTTQSAKF